MGGYGWLYVCMCAGVRDDVRVFSRLELKGWGLNNSQRTKCRIRIKGFEEKRKTVGTLKTFLKQHFIFPCPV